MTTPSTFHLAQMNVGRTVAPLDDPRIADFVGALRRINALGAAAPGFIWQLLEGDDSTTIRAYDDPRIIVNLTVWQDVDSLFNFTYHGEHVAFLRRRREWFEKPSGPSTVLWWVPAGHHPTVAEGVARLEHLQRHGPTAHAFTFKQRFDPVPNA